MPCIRTSSCVLLATVVCFASPLTGADPIITLNASDAASGDRFGEASSISGDWCAVGSPRKTVAGVTCGAVYLFKRNGAGAWTQVQTLTPATRNADQQFGAVIALRDDLLVVGAIQDNTAGDRKGAAFVYRRSGDTWTQVTRIIPSDLGTWARFPSALAISHDRVLMTSVTANQGLGAVYLHPILADGSLGSPEVVSDANDPQAGDEQYGFAAALELDTLAVGATKGTWRHNGLFGVQKVSTGLTYIYRRSNSSWTRIQTEHLTDAEQASSTENIQNFGRSLALSGNTLAIGGSNLGNIGSLENSSATPKGLVFTCVRQPDGTYQRSQRFSGSDTVRDDGFAERLALHGPQLVVAAPLDDDGTSNAGVLFRFAQSGGTWSQTEKISKTSPSTAIAALGNLSRLGASLAQSGNRLLVGAPQGTPLNFNFGDSSTGSGQAYILPVPDTTAPVLLAIDSRSPDGPHGSGSTIDVRLVFSEPVTLSGGALHVALDSGATVSIAPSAQPVYDLVGTYVVGASDQSSDLAVTAITTDAGAVIRDLAGNSVSAALPASSLAQRRNLVITQRPLISHIDSALADGVYRKGQTVTVQVVYDQAVTVSGVPILALNIRTPRYATYLSGSGTAVLTFSYVVAAADAARDLDLASAGALSGGVIRGAASLVLVDRTVPVGTSVSSLASRRDLVIDGNADVVVRDSLGGIGDGLGGAASDLGGGVAISGDVAVAGVPLHDGAGANAGLALFFERIGDTWQVAQRVTRPGETRFGKLVSISGSTAAIAADGRVFMYERGGNGQWSLAQTITNPARATFPELLSLDGNRVAIQAATWIEIHERPSLTAAWSLVQSFRAAAISISQPTVGLRLDGDRLVSADVANISSIPGRISGNMYVSVRASSGTWTRSNLIWTAGANDFDKNTDSGLFGYAVASSGGEVAASAMTDDANGIDSGSVFIFSGSGTTWTQGPRLRPADAGSRHQFGHALAMSGNLLLIGAPGWQDDRIGSGAVYAYRKNGSTWSQVAKTLPTLAADRDRFGSSLAMSGEWLMVGAPGDDVRAADAGAVFFTKLVDVLPPAAGVLGLTAASASVNEGASGSTTLTFTVARSNGSAGQVSVSYATIDGSATAGSDYAAAAGTVTWADGDTSAKTITVSITGDASIETDEVFFLSLSTPTNGAALDASVATITIINDDAAPSAGVLGFSSNTYTQVEGNSGTTVATITVTRSGGTTGAVTATWTAAAGSASAASDFIAASGTVTFPAGSSASQTFTVAILGDTTTETDETVLLSLGNPTNGAQIGLGSGSADLLIINDDSGTVVNQAPVITSPAHAQPATLALP